MAHLTQRTKHPCWANHFPCFYRQGGECSFWEKAKLMLETCVESSPQRLCRSMNVKDILSLPCHELTGEERRWGIPNLF